MAYHRRHYTPKTGFTQKSQSWDRLKRPKLIKGRASEKRIGDLFKTENTADAVANIIENGEAAGKSIDEILNDVKNYLDGATGSSSSENAATGGRNEWVRIKDYLENRQKTGSFHKLTDEERKMIKDAVKKEIGKEFIDKNNGTTAPAKGGAGRADETSQDFAKATGHDSSSSVKSEVADPAATAKDKDDAGSGSAPSGQESEYHCVDTRVIDRCIEQKDSFIRRYDKIVTDYNKIVDRLSANWVGRGADAFINDARVVRTNITGIADILANMVNVLTDIRQVLGEVDHQLGESNRNPDAE